MIELRAELQDAIDRITTAYNEGFQQGRIVGLHEAANNLKRLAIEASKAVEEKREKREVGSGK